MRTSISLSMCRREQSAQPPLSLWYGSERSPCYEQSHPAYGQIHHHCLLAFCGTSNEEDLIDPYRVAPELFGTQEVPAFNSPEWLRVCSARDRRCSLCPDVEASRLIPCCACENWVHLECSYGVPEGRLCAAHCQIIDPLKGVVVTDFNCPQRRSEMSSALAAVGEEVQVELGSPERPEALGMGSSIL